MLANCTNLPVFLTQQAPAVDNEIQGIIIINIIIIIIIVLGISFMQGIYTYIPETNHVPREHCVAAILM